MKTIELGVFRKKIDEKSARTPNSYTTYMITAIEEQKLCKSQSVKKIWLKGAKINEIKGQLILNIIRQALKAKIKPGKQKRKQDPLWLLAQTLNKIIYLDLVGKLDSEGHFTYGSSPFNVDLLK